MHRLLPSFCFALALSSCSIMGHTPMTRFESPEVQGETLRFEAQAAYQGHNEISLTPDYTFKAPTLSRPSVEGPDHRLLVQGAVGLGDRIDVSFSGPETRIGAKFQLTGDPRTRAEAGNFPVALYGGVGWNKERESGREDFFSNTSNQRSYELEELRYDIGLVLGYRPAPSILIYGGPFMVWDRMSTRYYPGNAGPSSEDSATARVFNANLGVQASLGGGSFLRLEAAGALTKLGGTESGKATWGVAAGTYF